MKTMRLIMNKRKMLGISLLSVLFFLSGCTVTQLEDRSFPMAIGIDKQENSSELLLSFDFPDLKEASGGDKEDQTPAAFTIEADQFYKAQKAYENNTNRIIDYNHLKALVFGKDFMADSKKIRELFSWLEYQEVLARNTCLFIADPKASKMLSLSKGTKGSVGKFLEQMVQSQSDFRKSKVMTIGKIMNQWHNQNETILIPILTQNGEIPVIGSYGIMRRFELVGSISVDDAMKAFLSQNMVRKMEYVLADQTVLDIQNISSTVKIKDENEKAYITVEIKGDAVPKNVINIPAKEMEQMKYKADSQLERSLLATAGELLEKDGIDITNSYILLGGYNRRLYELYDENPEEYEENITLEYEVSLTILNY